MERVEYFFRKIQGALFELTFEPTPFNRPQEEYQAHVDSEKEKLEKAKMFIEKIEIMGLLKQGHEAILPYFEAHQGILVKDTT